MNFLDITVKILANKPNLNDIVRVILLQIRLHYGLKFINTLYV